MKKVSLRATAALIAMAAMAAGALTPACKSDSPASEQQQNQEQGQTDTIPTAPTTPVDTLPAPPTPTDPTTPTNPDTTPTQPTQPTEPTKPALTGSISITGTPEVGQKLTATYSGNGTGTKTWKWIRGVDTIANASSNEYTLVSDDQGKQIKANVRFSGNIGSVESAQTAAIQPKYVNMGGVLLPIYGIEGNTDHIALAGHIAEYQQLSIGGGGEPTFNTINLRGGKIVLQNGNLDYKNYKFSGMTDWIIYCNADSVKSISDSWTPLGELLQYLGSAAYTGGEVNLNPIVVAANNPTKVQQKALPVQTGIMAPRKPVYAQLNRKFNATRGFQSKVAWNARSNCRRA